MGPTGVLRHGALGNPAATAVQQDLNLGLSNKEERASLKYKRGYFVDWRAADRLKKTLLNKIDFLLDTNNPDQPKLITREQLADGLRAGRDTAVPRRSLLRSRSVGRSVDEGGLRSSARCRKLCLVLRLRPRGEQPPARFRRPAVEIPSINLVFAHPHEFSVKQSTRVSAPNSPSASTSSTPWTAAISSSRCIR